MAAKQTERASGMGTAVLDSLPHPVLLVDSANKVRYANMASEEFLRSSVAFICRKEIEYFLPFGSPVLSLIDQVRVEQSGISEYRIDVSSPRLGKEKVVDVFAAPHAEQADWVVLQFLPKTAAEKLDRQLTHRNAARSITAMASLLAHEVKNPLSGIRGAAQLLEHSAGEDDRRLTLAEAAADLGQRLCRLFLPDADGRRPALGPDPLFRDDPAWRRHPLFYEYFHGDTGAGLGASHQTGWTALVAKLLLPRA